jgi:hypothetical protein
MATVTYIKESRQSVSAMKGVIDYCVQDFKVYDSKSKQRLVSGVNCNGENAFQEFMLTKNAYKKTTGMNFYQYVQSFSPDEKLTPKKVHQVAVGFAEKAWQGYEVMVATHCDADHIHSHFVINSVSFENGLKLRQNPNTLKSLRKLSDEICKGHNLTTLDPYEDSGKKLSTREYRVNERGCSWKQKLIAEIELAMQTSKTKEKFIAKLKADGYGVTWTDDRKYITFQTPIGMKCRDIKLHDDKFLKDNMEKEFYIRAGHYSNSTTGWEDTRSDFEKKVSEQSRISNSYSQPTNISNTVGSLAGSVSKIVDKPEDEEQRRKRIEAEENGNNLGAVIGTAIGTAVAIASSKKEETPHQDVDKIVEEYLKQKYGEDYFEEDETEDNDFTMSM